MPRRLISSNSSFEEAIGYSRAVIDGNWLFLSGTTGFNYQIMTISENIIEQTEQCFTNMESVLIEAGFSWHDVVRVRYILPNRDDFEPCWPTIKKYLGSVKPASTMIVAGLADLRMKIEIELTAYRSS
ncbi:Endoribonuclease L-PSP [Rippkaea orientalis PCC 8801]|uniref:Endoribonuclease L-PSP n=1 Tax=Rippkaea orientalis (strain PCC 8801 / RF-1) TaxID=41431 RepID=B7JXZ9_RIPO1|nr:RidA family protein [Rippkaea orientalis]ACK65963.1 Endoribonuclease L-PSP [Rippkaea orientalis PCC 8801]